MQYTTFFHKKSYGKSPGCNAGEKYNEANFDVT